MNTQLVDQHWFISLNGKRYGPYTFAALTEAAAKGVITADTSVWRLGWQQWHPASQVPGLLSEAPPPPAPEPPAESPHVEVDDSAPAERAVDEHPADERSRRTAARPEVRPSARRQREDDDAPAEGPRPRSRRPSRDEDAREGRERWRERDDEEAGDPPNPPDKRAPRAADTARDANRPRERSQARDEEMPLDTAKPRSRRPARDEDAPREAAARVRDVWSQDEDAPAETTKPRNRRPSQDDVRFPDATNLELEDLRPQNAPAADDEDDETPAPRNRRPSRDDDAPRDAAKRNKRSQERSPDGPRARDRRALEDDDTPVEKPRRRQLLEDEDDPPSDGWSLLDVRPSQELPSPDQDDRPAKELDIRPSKGEDSIRPASRLGREKAPSPASADRDEAPEATREPRFGRKKTHDQPPPRPTAGKFLKNAAIGLVFVLLLVGAGWALFASGVIAVVEPGSPNRSAEPKQQGALPLAAPQAAPVRLAAGDLPGTVSNLPAVVALSRSDPPSFERFKKRFAASAANAQEDELLSLARAALRKSVKRLLANSSGDTLLEITEAYLAYMQGLQKASPESCVALSDESKGAKLTSNLAKQFPIQFIRDMSVLERVASTSPTATVTPLTADQARPFLETVFNSLRQQQVKSELLGRDKLNPPEFEPYCSLVIAFYQAVLELPRDDKINLLRYLYASAATDPDSDLAK